MIISGVTSGLNNCAQEVDELHLGNFLYVFSFLLLFGLSLLLSKTEEEEEVNKNTR